MSSDHLPPRQGADTDRQNVKPLRAGSPTGPPARFVFSSVRSYPTGNLDTTRPWRSRCRPSGRRWRSIRPPAEVMEPGQPSRSFGENFSRGGGLAVFSPEAETFWGRGDGRPFSPLSLRRSVPCRQQPTTHPPEPSRRAAQNRRKKSADFPPKSPRLGPPV